MKTVVIKMVTIYWCSAR